VWTWSDITWNSLSRWNGAVRRQHLVQRDSERVDVAARVGVGGEHLLGRHVAAGAHRHSRARQAALAHHLGDAEVHHLDDALAIQHDVAGLDVAMNDAGAVGMAEPQQRLAKHGNGALGRQRSAAMNHLRECFAVDKFHHHHGVFAGGDERVKRGEIGVVEIRLRLRLAAKRATSSGTRARSPLSTLMATTRSSDVSIAL
jgi:hypothetical protein